MADNLPPPGDKLHDDLRALPKVDNSKTLNERAALAARLHIKESNRPLHDSLKQQLEKILDSIRPQLDRLETTEEQAEQYVLHEDELRAVVARSINAGAMQTAHSIGHVLHTNYQQVNEQSTDDDQLIAL